MDLLLKLSLNWRRTLNVPFNHLPTPQLPQKMLICNLFVLLVMLLCIQTLPGPPMLLPLSLGSLCMTLMLQHYSGLQTCTLQRTVIFVVAWVIGCYHVVVNTVRTTCLMMKITQLDDLESTGTQTWILQSFSRLMKRRLMMKQVWTPLPM